MLARAVFVALVIAAVGADGSLHLSAGASAHACDGTLVKAMGAGNVKVQCDKVEVGFRFHVHDKRAKDAFEQAQRWLDQLSVDVAKVTGLQVPWNISSWEYDSEYDSEYEYEHPAADTAVDTTDSEGNATLASTDSQLQARMLDVLERFTSSSRAPKVKYLFRYHVRAPVADADDETLLAISDAVISGLQSLKDTAGMGVTDGYRAVDTKWSLSPEAVQSALKVARRQAVQKAQTSAKDYGDALGFTVSDAALGAPISLEEDRDIFDPNMQDMDYYSDQSSFHAPMRDVGSGVRLSYCFGNGARGTA